METNPGYTVVSRRSLIRTYWRLVSRLLRHSLPDASLDDRFCCQSDGQDAPGEGRLAPLAAGELLREGHARPSEKWGVGSSIHVGSDAARKGGGTSSSCRAMTAVGGSEGALP